MVRPPLGGFGRLVSRNGSGSGDFIEAEIAREEIMRGHVRERGKGNWYAVLSVRDQQTGKRKVRFISLPDAKGKREAQQALARIVTELGAGTFVEPSKTTVAKFLQRWLDHIQTQVQPRTVRFYAEQVANLIP